MYGYAHTARTRRKLAKTDKRRAIGRIHRPMRRARKGVKVSK